MGYDFFPYMIGVVRVIKLSCLCFLGVWIPLGCCSMFGCFCSCFVIVFVLWLVVFVPHVSTGCSYGLCVCKVVLVLLLCGGCVVGGIFLWYRLCCGLVSV